MRHKAPHNHAAHVKGEQQFYTADIGKNGLRIDNARGRVIQHVSKWPHATPHPHAARQHEAQEDAA